MQAEVEAGKLPNNIQTSASQSFFPNLLPEEEIQKVIFDQQYLKYMKKRMAEETNTSSFGNIAVNSTNLGGVTD